MKLIVNNHSTDSLRLRVLDAIRRDQMVGPDANDEEIWNAFLKNAMLRSANGVKITTWKEVVYIKGDRAINALRIRFDDDKKNAFHCCPEICKFSDIITTFFELQLMYFILKHTYNLLYYFALLFNSLPATIRSESGEHC